MTILASKMLFVCEKLLDKKIFSSFSRKFGYLLSKKDLEKKSDPFRSDPWFFGSTIRSRSFCQKWIYNPIRSFHPPEKRIYDPILSDPFRSFPIRSLSCLLKDTVPQILCFLNLTTFLMIARSHKIMILLRNANFSLKNAICLWKITGWENLFFIFKKIWLSFVQKDLEKKSDHFRSDPWFLDLRIRSRSFRRKWIYDPITILKNGDLDPKGSRSSNLC